MVKDPNIVLSIINLKLRDYYNSLDELIDDLEDGSEMVELLIKNDYQYVKEINQFRKK
jgi:cell division protein FtsB